MASEVETMVLEAGNALEAGKDVWTVLEGQPVPLRTLSLVNCGDSPGLIRATVANTSGVRTTYLIRKDKIIAVQIADK